MRISLRPIVFLHVPKTAGQTIRISLKNAFPRRRVFPGQVDAHLSTYSREDLTRFDIFSGHFSWSLLDCLGPDVDYITILRDPVERVLSYYRHLRRLAESLTPDQLDLPQNGGLKLALRQPLEVFLEGVDQASASFVASHFDNFYAYYFGTRCIGGRYLIRDSHAASDVFITEKVVENALRNLDERVRVFNYASLQSLAASFSGEEGYRETEIPMSNSSGSFNHARMLGSLSSDVGRAREQLHLRCQHDQRVFDMFCS